MISVADQSVLYPHGPIVRQVMTFFIFTECESRYNHQEPQWTGPAPGGGEQNGNSQNEVNVCYRGRGEMENALHSISPSVTGLWVSGL